MNTAVGQAALTQMTTGNRNTGIGLNAGQSVTTGAFNTFVGSGAAGGGAVSITGNDNIAVGSWHDGVIEGPLGGLSSGNANVAIGNGALRALTTGTQNVAVGHGCNNNNISGDTNTFIGYNVVIGNTATDATIAIGSNFTSASSNNVRIGTAAGTATLTLDGSDTSWAAASDERLKKDIVTSTVGLSFINDLRPVTFKWNAKNAIANTLPQYDADSSDPVYGEGKAHHGFIAQEVKAVIDAHSDVVDGHNLWTQDEDGTQQLAQGALVPMLVKAIQEQQVLIETLTARIETLEG